MPTTIKFHRRLLVIILIISFVLSVGGISKADNAAGFGTIKINGLSVIVISFENEAKNYETNFR